MLIGPSNWFDLFQHLAEYTGQGLADKSFARPRRSCRRTSSRRAPTGTCLRIRPCRKSERLYASSRHSSGCSTTPRPRKRCSSQPSSRCWNKQRTDPCPTISPGPALSGAGRRHLRCVRVSQPGAARMPGAARRWRSPRSGTTRSSERIHTATTPSCMPTTRAASSARSARMPGGRIRALSAERPDHPFGHGIRARARHRCGDGMDADPSGAGPEIAAVDASRSRSRWRGLWPQGVASITWPASFSAGIQRLSPQPSHLRGRTWPRSLPHFCLLPARPQQGG